MPLDSSQRTELGFIRPSFSPHCFAKCVSVITLNGRIGCVQLTHAQPTQEYCLAVSSRGKLPARPLICWVRRGAAALWWCLKESLKLCGRWLNIERGNERVHFWLIYQRCGLGDCLIVVIDEPVNRPIHLHDQDGAKNLLVLAVCPVDQCPWLD